MVASVTSSRSPDEETIASTDSESQRPVEHARQVGMRDQAFLDRHDVMGTMATQAGPSGLIDGESHPGPPAEVVRLDRLDLAVPRQAGQPIELLADDRGEQPPLTGG